MEFLCQLFDADDGGRPATITFVAEFFNGLRYVIRYGIAWRAMPNDLPPWAAVYQQTQRWLRAGCFESMAEDLRLLLRLAGGRTDMPSATIFDSRTLQSTPESGSRAGFDGHKKRKGSKLHAAVDTLGHLLALKVTPANEQDREQVAHRIDDRGRCRRRAIAPVRIAAGRTRAS